MLQENKRSCSVLIVGQTPPPYHGQAIMIESLVTAKFSDIKLIHVRMAFSKSIGEVSRFKARKILELFSVIVRVLYAKIRYRPDILYYPPSGPRKVPVIRDLIILNCVRPFFKKVVFHFHAAGVSSMYERMPWFLKWAFRGAYFYPSVALRLTPMNPEDGKLLKATREYILPNGIDDHWTPAFAMQRAEVRVVTIVFVGIVGPTKGVKILLESCLLLRNQGHRFLCKIVGNFESQEFEEEARGFVSQHGLAEWIEFSGPRYDADKWDILASSDIFCYPTFYENEAFGISMVEAMQFKLPVVATRWRGLPWLIDHGKTGLIAEPQNSADLANQLTILIEDEEMRVVMGNEGRKKYLNEFTRKVFLDRTEMVFKELAGIHSINEEPSYGKDDVRRFGNSVLL